jgi:protein gp37
MAKSKIQWTDETWNPVTGCNKVSAGCKNYYAEVMSERLFKMGLEKYKNNFEVTLHPEELKRPFTWKKPRMVFVNSMSDLFHEKVPFHFIYEIMCVISQNPQHIFQILTKRPGNAKKYGEINIMAYIKHLPDNVWLGVSVENDKVLDRIEILKQIPAKVKFLSCEPLLGLLGNLDLKGIDWVICGAESGNKKREMKCGWAFDLMTECKIQGVPFFMKQMFDGNGKKLKFEEFPEALQVREYPNNSQLEEKII